jgi:hypothetical protein
VVDEAGACRSYDKSKAGMVVVKRAWRYNECSSAPVTELLDRTMAA